MDTVRTFLLLVYIGISLLFGSSETVLENSHEGDLNVNMALYEIDRERAEDYLKGKLESGQCLDDLPFALPSSVSLPSLSSNEARGTMIYGTFTPNVTEDFADDTYRLLWMTLGVARRSDGRQMNHVLAVFTDSEKPVLNPLLTEVNYIDSITEEGGTVTMRNGNDTMVFQIPEQMCSNGEGDSEKRESEWRSLRDNLWNSYPDPPNLSVCDRSDWETSPFCSTVSADKCLLQDNKGDFCIRFSQTGTKKRCRSFMRIIEATGIFACKSLLGDDKYPRDMLGVEWLESHRTYDIIYPCFA